MAAAVPALLVVGTLISGAGAIYSANAQKAEARYSRQIAERNATIVQQQAAVSEAAARRDGRRAIGKIQAGYGASGVVGNEGSPLDVLENSATEAELDALTIRYNGELGAMGYKDDARLATMRGRAAGTEGAFRAGSALLSGATAYGEYQSQRPKRT